MCFALCGFFLLREQWVIVGLDLQKLLKFLTLVVGVPAGVLDT